MELVNEFTVDAPVATVWATVGDLEQVAQCLPGAQIDSVDGAEYTGRVTVKVGPISLGLAGTARVVDRDDAEHRMVVEGQARDRHGQGSAAATITVEAFEAAGRTEVRVVTDVALGGRIAQFGAGMIKQVSERIVKEFVRRLNELVLTPEAAAAAAERTELQRANRVAVPGLVPAAGAVFLAGVVLGWALGRALRPSLRN